VSADAVSVQHTSWDDAVLKGRGVHPISSVATLLEGQKQQSKSEAKSKL
jgi:hypothetical protein